MTRGKPRILLPPSWLRGCAQWCSDNGLDYVQAGAALARAAGRDHPYHRSVISRYMAGELPNPTITAAFAHLRGVRNPLAMPSSEQEIEFATLADRLRRDRPASYELLLALMRQLLDA